MTIKNISSILKIHQHLDIIDIFEFKNVNEIQIDNEIKEMNSKKAPGVDGIPVNILKQFTNILNFLLTKLFNVYVEKHQLSK